MGSSASQVPTKCQPKPHSEPQPCIILFMSEFIRAQDVLSEQFAGHAAQQIDQQYGNEDLLYALNLLGLAGPFMRVTPWELADQWGVQRIHAAGYAAVPFGEMPPVLTEFVQQYLQRNRTMGLPQQSASAWRAALQYNLIRLLSRELPSHRDSQVFFGSSGTEAIEGAMKFAKASRPKATHFISFAGGYHGKTYGSLSLTPNTEYQNLFRPLLPDIRHVPYGDLEAFRGMLRRLGPDQVVAVIVEPIQGEGGVNIPPLGFLSGLGEICQRHGIIVIADEIQTGLGRTGHWFESAAQGLDADIITLAKPLGGGMVAVGATIVRQKLYKTMLGGLSSKRHSNTFGGNSLAMAVGLKSLEHLIDQDLPARSRMLGEQGLEHLQRLKARFPELLQDVRGRGLLMALQFHPVTASGTLGVMGSVLGDVMGDVVGEATAILALRALHEHGVMANLSLSSKCTVRYTPALDIPEQVFAQLLERTTQFAQNHPSARHLLTRTPPAVTLKLGRFALERPKARGL